MIKIPSWKGAGDSEQDVRYVMGEVLQVMAARVGGRKADGNSGVSLFFRKRDNEG